MRHVSRVVVVAATFLFAATAIAQSIFTVAGGGPIGDGLPATQALLREPWDTALDAAGNLYISDTKNQRVRKVDARTGVITTFAGGGTSGRGDGGAATEAELNDPVGLAIDSDGNLYIGSGNVFLVGSGQGGVRRVSPDGIITTYAKVDFALGMAFDRDGNLHVPLGATVQRIDRRTGIFTTVAGTGTFGFSGDGGPATAALMSGPSDLVFDRAGNLYIADTFNQRVRRVEASTGIITTAAGNGSNTRFEPGKLATETNISTVESIALDADGNLFIGGGVGGVIHVDARTAITSYASRPGPNARGLTFDSSGNLFTTTSRNLVQKLAPTSDIPTTVAGGRSIGDGAPATSSSLFLPYEVLALPNGDLVFTDSSSGRIRKVEASSGRVITIAGTPGEPPFSYDGVPALQATFPPPLGIARDSSGNLYFSTMSLIILKIDAASGIITKFAGNFPPKDPFSGDGGPATAATFSRPLGLAVHPNGDLYIADSENHRIRKIDARTGIITTFAGSGSAAEGSFAGDGGPASSARLNTPRDVAFDGAGNLYISDTRNGRIRKVDAANETITTIAGDPFSGAAEGPALRVRLDEVEGMHSDAAGNLWFTLAPGGVRYLDARTGLVSIIAGSGKLTYNGDGGPARAAGLNRTTGVAVDARGTVFIADRNNNRIRAVFACVAVSTPTLTAPVDGATDVGSAPTLAWGRVDGAFRYDVYLSATSPPNTKVASDVSGTSFTPSNLLPSTTYYWSVVAKGDPFCPTVSTAASAVRSFTTSSACEAPASFALLSPADLGDVTPPLQLSWQGASGAGSYDILLGTTNPPPLAGSTTTTSLSVSALAAGTTYYWSVVAHAECDSTKTRSTSVRSFRTAGGCPTPGAFSQTSPAPGATNVASTARLVWSNSANATSYDLYLGTTNPPPIYLPSLTSTQVTISTLSPGATYFWRIVARAGCDPTRTTSTPVASFSVRTACNPPKPTSFRFTPPGNVAAGQSYVVAWNDAAELEPNGYYVLERATDPSFAAILDTQQTSGTSASFIASSAGTYHHRVTPVNPCGGGTGSAAQSKVLNVVPTPPNIIFSVQPEPVLTRLGENLEDKRARFVIENIASDPISVIMARQEIDSVPFFTVADPLGGESTFFTLAPRKPKEFEIHFSGPPNDKPASYQGIVLLAALGKGLTITPYAFVNLRVGGGDASAPQFRSDGTGTEYAFFPGFAGDDAMRLPITVDIHNSGPTAMELAAEIGPEVWLIPESGWNSTAIAPGGTRTVKLFTRRNHAPNGSALPRYTYFTVRTKAGLSARLLVQDNDLAPIDLGRGAALDPSIRSLIVPEVISTDSRTFSTLRLSNIGSEAVQVDLFFTPADADGFDPVRVRRATIAVPPNDVVTLTDPLAQLWGLSRPARGQVEVRAPQEKLGLIAVRSNVTRAADDGGAFGYVLPTLTRGEGARTSSAHAIAGITTDDQTRAVLTLAETSGTDRALVRVALLDSGGSRKGERTVELPRYSMTEIDEVVAALGGGTSITARRIEIAIASGGGSVVGIVKLLDRTSGGGSTLASRAVVAASTTQSAAALAAAMQRSPLRIPMRAGEAPSAPLRAAPGAPLSSASATARTFFVPVVVNGTLTTGSSQTYQTVLGLTAPGAPRRFTITYRDGSATAKSATVTVAANNALEYRNVLEQTLGVAAGAQSEGSLLVETDGDAQVYARLVSTPSGVSRVSVSQAVPVIGDDSELVTSATSQRPLYLDGLEQSIDPTRGSRWMLLLSELGGKASTLVVRLYEAGNRSAPIAEKEFPLGALVRLKLDNLFAALDLDSISRRKDRTNMLMSVVLKSGGGIAAATAVAIDNKTGDSKTFALAPGSATAVGLERVTAIAPPTPSPGRRRATGH